MKKLLILGGNALSTDIVTTAQSMGIYTIVTDWNDTQKSPAKLIADEAWDVSITDYDELERRVKEYGVDGIFTNYTDSYLIPYSILCERCGLPCLANSNQIDSISLKDKSKRLCKESGIAVTEAHEVKNFDELKNLIRKGIKYPVLLKPVDQSGQRGIYVCNNEQELLDLYEESKSFSASGGVLVEDYLSGDYVVMFFTIQNGHVTISTMADKPVSPVLDKNLVKLPLAYILPSKYIKLCKSTVLPGVQSFVNELGLKNGVIGMEAIVKDDKIHVFEMQFRLGGMRHHEFVLQENGMNLMEMLIRFAVSGKFDGWDASKCDKPEFSHKYVLLNVLVNLGTIGKVEGIEGVRELPFVTKVTQMYKEGDEIKLPSTVNQILCKVSMKLNKEDDLSKMIETVVSMLDARDVDGQTMICDYWKSIV